MIKEYIQKKKISISLIIGTISSVIGFMLLLFSPGSQIRLKLTVPTYSEMSMYQKVYRGLTMFVGFMTDDFPLLLVFFIISIFCNCYCSRCDIYNLLEKQRKFLKWPNFYYWRYSCNTSSDYFTSRGRHWSNLSRTFLTIVGGNSITYSNRFKSRKGNEMYLH